MTRLNLKEFNPEKSYQKNVLYKISKDAVISFEERHVDNDNCEYVDLIYQLCSGQYGIFAYEFRNPLTLKEGCKTADILACAVDENKKRIATFIFDVKSNISAFSDNLLKDSALLTVIKEVRDFIEQIHAEILHKESFLIYYRDEGFIEDENIGIITKRFEETKFASAADMLEDLFQRETPSIPKLVEIKLKNNLGAYRNEVKRIRDFSEKTVILCGRIYDLKVVLLKNESGEEYRASIRISVGGTQDAVYSDNICK